MAALRVLVVGASIAGPTAAYWFARAGASVTVIERFPYLRTGGHNIDIRTSGVTVMRRMPGLETAVQQQKMQLDGLCLVGNDGKPYGTIRRSSNPDQQTLLSEYDILRGVLSKCIYDMSTARKNVEYRFGEEIQALAETQDCIQVEFLSGKKQEFDLVVACDGTGSRTRKLAFGDEAEHGIRKSTGCWAAYFSIADILPEGSEKLSYGNSSVPGRFMSVEPKSEGQNIVQMMSHGNNAESLTKFREANKAGPEALKSYLAKAFEGHGWRIQEVLSALSKSEDLYASEITKVRVSQLSKGRVVLVGDAGYAPGFTGTGTTLALTGAYLLAGEISKHTNDLKAGLKAYEVTMRPLVEKMSWVLPFVPGIMAPQTPFGLWLRNSIFAVLAWSKLLEYAERFFGGGAGGKVSEYPLPEYEWPEQ